MMTLERLCLSRLCLDLLSGKCHGDILNTLTRPLVERAW